MDHRTPEQAAADIARTLSALADDARTHQLDTLAYLISVATMEAEHISASAGSAASHPGSSR